MTRARRQGDVDLVAYGSLMSGYGLEPLGRLEVRAAARVVLRNARRGFAKYSQRGDRFAMALDPAEAGHPITGRRLAADEPATDAPEGLVLTLAFSTLRRVSQREGYDAVALDRLQSEAERRGKSLAGMLWTILEGADFDLGTYRTRLFELVGYASPHYVPHPVPIGDAPAVAFLAPGAEGTGSPGLVSVRVRTGDPPLMTAREAWQARPNATQLRYFSACFLAALHGICQRDVIDGLASDPDLLRQLRWKLTREQPTETPRFLRSTGLAEEAYRTAFGPPSELPARSGLKHLFEDHDVGE